MTNELRPFLSSAARVQELELPVTLWPRLPSDATLQLALLCLGSWMLEKMLDL